MVFEDLFQHSILFPRPADSKPPHPHNGDKVEHVQDFKGRRTVSPTGRHPRTICELSKQHPTYYEITTSIRGVSDERIGTIDYQFVIILETKVKGEMSPERTEGTETQYTSCDD